MGVTRIMVCHECKEYVDLDKGNDWQNDYYTWKIFLECALEFDKYDHHKIFSFIKFIWKHNGHKIKEIYDYDDEYMKILYGVDPETVSMDTPFDRKNGYKEFEIEYNLMGEINNANKTY